MRLTNRRECVTRTLGIFLAAALLPGIASAQQATVGATLTEIVSGGTGVERSCLQPKYATGLGLRVSVPVLSRWTTLQAAGRGYWLERGSTCVDGFPPPAGTYIQEDRINLMARSFVTTDVRLAARLGQAPVQLALGGGNAWHEGHDLPYLLFAGELTVVDRPTVRLGLAAEYQQLRVTSDQYRRTYDDFGPVSEEFLGQVHQWSHAFLLGVTLDVPF